LYSECRRWTIDRPRGIQNVIIEDFAWPAVCSTMASMFHNSHPSDRVGRRTFLTSAFACALSARTSVLNQSAERGVTLSKDQRDSMSPDEVIEALKKGQERFRAGRMMSRDYRAQQRASAAAQFPAAVVLGCVDSRVPAEVIFDAGLGDLFNARIAGNVV